MRSVGHVGSRRYRGNLPDLEVSTYDICRTSLQMELTQRYGSPQAPCTVGAVVGGAIKIEELGGLVEVNRVVLVSLVKVYRFGSLDNLISMSLIRYSVPA